MEREVRMAGGGLLMKRESPDCGRRIVDGKGSLDGKRIVNGKRSPDGGRRIDDRKLIPDDRREDC
jgi:hypothetical protein